MSETRTKSRQSEGLGETTSAMSRETAKARVLVSGPPTIGSSERYPVTEAPVQRAPHSVSTSFKHRHPSLHFPLPFLQ